MPVSSETSSDPIMTHQQERHQPILSRDMEVGRRHSRLFTFRFVWQLVWFVCCIDEPWNVRENNDMSGILYACSFELCFEPLVLFVERVESAGRVGVELVVEDNELNAADSEGEVVVTESSLVAVDVLGSGSIPNVVISAHADQRNIIVNLAHDPFESRDLLGTRSVKEQRAGKEWSRAFFFRPIVPDTAPFARPDPRRYRDEHL
mmetsp:Transcript_1151/g.3226  ORF Transcript_1151/g.3226 Transcript_1151/m.3226 type:complete len:205 (-) Transcript_1151:614-1228(-)